MPATTCAAQSADAQPTSGSKMSPHIVAKPEEQARRKQLADMLTRALDTLPLEQRVAIVLCDVEDRTSAEAAQIVGVPEQRFAHVPSTGSASCGKS